MIAIYARQSVEKKDSLSIESQIDLCRKEVCQEDLYRIYKDSGYSGKNMERPAFQRLIEDIKKGEIHKVIIYKLDRMSRSLLDFAKLMELFQKYDVKFQSTQEKFDTSTPIGNAMLSITMVFAQLERETIAGRIKDNYYARGKKGFYMGGRPAYGFRKILTCCENKRTGMLVPDEKTVEILKRIFFQWGENTGSLSQIARKLNKEKIPGPSGKAPWDSSKITRILRNPVYVMADAEVYLYFHQKGYQITNKIEEFTGIYGCFLYGRREEKVPAKKRGILSLGLHQGIIDSSLFLRCQKRLDSNTQIRNEGKGSHSFLSGLIKCGSCGYAMTVISSGSKGEKRYYFYCSGAKNKRCKGQEMTHSVEKVEIVVEKEIFRLAQKHPEFIYYEKKINQKENNTIQIRLLQINQEIQRLISQIGKGERTVDQYLKEEIQKLDTEKKTIFTKQKEKCKEFKKISFLDLCKKWAVWNLDQKKEIVRLLIERVVLKEELIEIYWNYAFLLK